MRNDSKISPIPPLKNRVHEFSRMTVVQGAWGPALREKAIYTLACLAGSPDHPVADEILNSLRRISPEAMTRTEINGLFKGRKKTGELSQALHLLQSLGLAKPENQKTEGRPSEAWYAL